MYQIYDPATTTLVNGTYVRTPFPNNQIPQSRIDPISKSIINYVQPLLKPNVAGLRAGHLGLRSQQLHFRRHRAYRRTTSTASRATRCSPRSRGSRSSSSAPGSRTCAAPPALPACPRPCPAAPGTTARTFTASVTTTRITPTLLNRFYAGGNNWEQNHGSFAHLQRRAAGPGTSHHHPRAGRAKGSASRTIPTATSTFRRSIYQQRVHQLGPARPQRLGQHRGGIP